MATEANTTFKVLNQEFVKLDRFDGSNFNRWKDNMMFLLTILNMVNVLDPNLQPVEDLASNANSKEIAKVVELKKKREEENFTYQRHILNTLSNRLLRDSKVVIPKLLQVEVIISKLPSSWNNYRKKLLYMVEDFTVEWRKYLGICILKRKLRSVMRYIFPKVLK
ncbi:hypothetical protein J1N35_011934 [Gossypium stocksii]|uniref:Uncharacterized protein n=1 Tax=Gossypium stocksii TaxID=47602 RepID=A0A9D4AE24_9ROSI|nr:hypothetical protein J1N35_011934 [Gossypium stocksii]